MAWTRPSRSASSPATSRRTTARAQRTLDALEDMRLQPRGALRRRAGRDHRRRPPHPGLARRRAPVPARRAARRRSGRTALPRRLGDGRRAPRAQRRVPRPPRRRRGLARRPARDRRAPLRADRARPRTTRLPPPWGPRKFARYVRWAWLIEGGAQYFAGQTQHFRAAVNTRMRQGERARVPALGPRRDHPRRHRLRPARARARPRRLRGPRLAPAPRGRRAGDRARLRRALPRRRGPLAHLPARGPAPRVELGELELAEEDPFGEL